jgi:hypothetical protein
MGRSHIDISSYKDEIVDQFNKQETNKAIRMELARRYSINISYRTLSRRLQDWGLRRLPTTTAANNQALCDSIRFLVCDNLSDKEILPILHHEGFKIAPVTLKRLRQQLGLRLRTDDPEARALQAQQIREVVQQEIHDGKIEGFGRGLLHTYLRQKRHIFPCNRVFSIYRLIYSGSAKPIVHLGQITSGI